MIPYSTQDINENDIRVVSRVLRSGWITQGPAISSFEKAIAKKVGARYCVALNSGTAALHAAYAAAGIREGDEVIVPAITFAATANAALFLGAKPVFADIDPTTGLMDLKDAERKITKRTKAIIPVDYGGRPADLRMCSVVAKRHGLIFIEDGAQSLGATYSGKPVGVQAAMTIFSFHPVKSITTGEGGVVVTNNSNYYQYVMKFRTHGITKHRELMEQKGKADWYHEMQVLGFNYRMTDIQAALGESQLKRLDSFISRRRAKVALYEKLLSGTPDVLLPPPDTHENRSAWHLYPIRLSKRLSRHRDSIFTKLRERGVGVQVHYLPVYLHPYYRNLGYRSGLCPNAEVFASSVLSIPLYPKLSVKDQSFVANTLREVITMYI